ncbi:LysR family transcriptional regulator [Paraglaciecola polaris]|uniref:LysR family transcriptional regulator n=1 Tax=Paraglaciecola polaris TaxID=222814 RepID=UPI0030ED6014
MRLRHIEIFHAIYTTGSITNAAKILHVSQPAVSKVLHHAELQLGFALFTRNKGRLVPTPEADMLFNEVDKIHQQMRSIDNTAHNIKHAHFGKINIGITPALGFDVLPKAIARYHQQHPNVSFNINTVHNDAVLQSLIEHKSDVAVLFQPSSQMGVNSIDCGQSELVVVYPKALFPHLPEQLNMQTFKDVPFIDISDSGPLGDMLYSRLQSENMQLRSPIQVQTYFIAARLVAQGLGICVVDRHTAKGNLTDDTAIASFAPPLGFSINAVHLQNRPLSKALQGFLPFLQAEISQY